MSPAAWRNRAWTYPVVQRSSSSPRQKHRLEPILGVIDLGALDGRGRIHILRANFRAFAYERALPDAVVAREHRFSLILPLIARVHVVAVTECDRCGAEELRLEPIDRTCGVAEHAVDALGELMESLELRGRLAVLALGERLFRFADDPRFHALELVQKVTHVDHQVADNREVGERLDADFLRMIVTLKCRA